MSSVYSDKLVYQLISTYVYDTGKSNEAWIAKGGRFGRWTGRRSREGSGRKLEISRPACHACSHRGGIGRVNSQIQI